MSYRLLFRTFSRFIYKRENCIQHFNIQRFQLINHRHFQTLKPIETNDLADNDNHNGHDDLIRQYRLKHQIHVENVANDHAKTIFKFDELNLPGKIHEILIKNQFIQPTPIQAQALPILFSNQDLIGIAQTGSGKTLAYLLPAFCQLYSIHRNYWTDYNDEQSSTMKQNLKPKVLILAPTRELAVQIFDMIRKFKIYKSICLYGGNDRRKQIEYLNNNKPLFLVSTPGRLNDLIDSNVIDLSGISYLVIDEADRMLDMGFEPQISTIIDKCPHKNERQTMMFSATWPEEVKMFANKYLKEDHAFISIGGTKLVANHNIKQNIIVCDSDDRRKMIYDILSKHSKEKILLFCNRKIECDRLARQMHYRLQIPSSALHGDMTQRQRESTLNNFKNGRIRLLCATDVAARGLDIDDVSVVINYDFPMDIETYVHRIGRTGRKDNKGLAYSFFNNTEESSNSSLARKLIEILNESNNEIPVELMKLSMSSNSSSKKNYSKFMGNKRKPFIMNANRRKSI